ncbi:hypothetical protein AbraIFM66951_007786 [Aspergillus brasiliensis]|nr:hypothetical protein AbraIFM66951_007786 [Aspergillus brasiliensis]
MEKAVGVGLQTSWHGMSKRDRHKLASSIVEFDEKFFNIPCSTRSLYFKAGIQQDLQTALYAPSVPNTEDSEVFCIGPTADYMFSYAMVSQWHDQVGGISEEGWISNKNYDETVQRVAELKSALIASAEGDKEDIRLL